MSEDAVMGGKSNMMRFSMRGVVFFAAVLLAVFCLPAVAVADSGYESVLADYQKFYAHYSPPGIHTDTESYKDVPVTGRHANCNDCHDAHSATRAASPLGSYFGAGTQANVSGVRPLYWGRNPDGTVNFSDKIVAPGDAPGFVFLSSVVKEYELCFKCHSNYSFGGAPPKFNWTQGRYWQSDDPVSDIVVQETDTSMEFNPNNASYLPVVARGKTPGSKVLYWAGGISYNATFVSGYSATSLVKCSDCHAADETGIKGPHGSNNKYILKKRAPSEEPTVTVTSTLGAIESGEIDNGGVSRRSYTMTWYVRTNDNLCYECHKVEYYGYGKGHPSAGPHSGACGTHYPTDLSTVGCATCKVAPIHGSPTNTYMMRSNWCFVCHNAKPGQVSDPESDASCPRFYSYADDGWEVEETRVHFQSSRIKAGEDYFVPLPTPDMPNLKGLGNVAAYRYYNREDDYILFKAGKPKEEDGFYKVRFDQPSIGDRPDGELVGEVGYEDQISLWTVDHEPGTQVYLSVDGDAYAVKNAISPKSAVDDKGNNVLDIVSDKSPDEEKGGWFTGTIDYGNTIDEIYSKGNYFILDFGDLSKAKTVKLLWKVNELKGAKLPVLIQTKDENGKWVTRDSARTAEDRYGAMDLKPFFPAGTKKYKVKVIPTLNFIDWMAVSTKDESVKVTKIPLAKADYKKYPGTVTDATSILKDKDGNYLEFDYKDEARLYFPVPPKNTKLTKRSFVFAPVGYYETGGLPSEYWESEPMTGEKAQDFARVTPAGDYANHYRIELIDPDEWNERHGFSSD